MRSEPGGCAVGATLALLLIAALGPARTVAAQAPASPVRTAPVESRELADRIRATGEVRAASEALVAAPEEGRVVEVLVEEGDLVERGAPLARLDDRRLRLERDGAAARLRVARAVIRVREAELGQARADRDALAALDAGRASNPKEAADAERDLLVAEARLAEATADADGLASEIALLDLRLDDMTIRAPFDGAVIERLVEPGAWAGTGDGVARLVTRGRYDLIVDVPQEALAALARGEVRPTVVVPAAGVAFADMERWRIVPRVDPVARTFRLLVPVTVEDGVLADGMSAVGWVPVGAVAPRLLVPRDAVLENAAGYFVYAVRPGPGGAPTAMPVRVDMTFEVDGLVCVRAEGLDAGDRVVVEGNERLFPMSAVREVDPEAEAVGGGGGAEAAGR